jgi:hypothetical protein
MTSKCYYCSIIVNGIQEQKTKLFFQTFLYPPLPLQGGERKVPSKEIIGIKKLTCLPLAQAGKKK